MLWEPGEIEITLNSGSDTHVAKIDARHVPTEPLTMETKRALASKAQTAKAVRMRMECVTCHDGITPFVALERKPSEGNTIWYEELPDTFTCQCGGFRVPLHYLRAGMPSYLAQFNNILPDGSVVEPAITREDAFRIVDDFRVLLTAAEREEELQIFIQDHPILLSPFAARKIYFKPAILTRYRADFGIWTGRNELLLIEIERANLRLTNNDGGQAASLTHAIDQTREWEHVITEHRRATLETIDPEIASVTSIRYIVIAGRASGSNNPEHLNRLLRSNRHPEFMTYDHLLASVEAVIKATF